MPADERRTTSPAPATGGSLRLLGSAARLHESGRLDEAERAYAALLREHPDDPTALINAGALALGRNDIPVALARLRRAVALQPANAIARNNLGFAELQAGEPTAALASLDAAVGISQHYAQAHNNRGIALARLGRTADAIAAFDRALALEPRAVDAATNLGEIHAREGDGPLARAAFERALAIDPHALRARIGAALATALTGDLVAAREALEAITRDHPDDADAWQTLGAVANWSFEHDAAHAAFAAALARRPGDAEAAFGIASTLLARGRFREGFAAFEQRREGIGAAASRFAGLPAWNGATLPGTLLLYPEQGLGDVVQFVRFASAARHRVRRIVLLLDGYWVTLSTLLESAAGVDRVVTDERDVATEAVAARASLLSLPHLLDIAAPSSTGPYLAPPAARADAWRARMADVASPRVGLAWSVFARSDYGYVTRHKSIPPPMLAPLLDVDVDGVRFVTLQPGGAGDPAVFGPRATRIVDPREAIRDFADTAALIATLDLLITPDTAVAHVAGALGRPVWLLDRYNSCWRWRIAPDRSPWYPSMRIFRQARFGDWTGPVDRAAAALRDVAAGHPA